VITQILVLNVPESDILSQTVHAQIIITLMTKELVKTVIINVKHVPTLILVTPVDPKLTEFKTD